MGGAPGEIRTPDRSVRSRVLYPAELQAHNLKARFYGYLGLFASVNSGCVIPAKAAVRRIGILE